MKPDILRVNICLDRQQHAELKSMSRKTGKSMSRIIRESLETSLPAPSNRLRKPRFRFIGMGRGGGRNVARDHDRHLYGS